MKRDIGYVGLDPEFVKWLRESLKTPSAKLAGAGEFLEGIEELAHGKVDALMLEMGMNEKVNSFASTIVCGEITIYPMLHKVTRSGKEIMLTPKEFDILLFLVQNRGEVFTKEQIYRAVWSDDYLLDDSNIMAFIRKLRKKIEPNPDSPEYILTIWGIGYKFNDQL